MRLLLNVLLACQLCLFACNPSGTPQAQSAADSLDLAIDWSELSADDVAQEALREAMRSSKTMLLIYPDAHATAFASICERVKTASRRIEVLYKPASQVTQQDLQTQPLLFMGSPESLPFLEKVAAKIPFEISKGIFSTGLKSYENDDDVLLVGMIASPFSETPYPVTAFIGNSDKAVVALLENVYANNWRRVLNSGWGYQIYRGRQRVVMGNFQLADSIQLQMNASTHWDFESTTVDLPPTTHFRVVQHGAVDSARMAQFLALSELSMTNLAQELQKNAPESPPFVLHFYASSEEKGLLTNNTAHSHIDFEEQGAHIVLNGAYQDNFSGEEMRLLQRKLLGESKTAALEIGLANGYAPKWQRLGTAYWMGKICQSGNLVPLAELLDNEFFAKESPLIFGAMAGGLVQLLQEVWGKEAFFRKYADWKPNGAEIAALSPAWEAFGKRMAEAAPKNAAWKQSKPMYYKGFNFAHEGYQIYNGYGSKLAEQSVNRLKNINSNALALVPYTYMEHANKPSFLSFSQWAGSETDESVVHSAHYAKRQGLSTLLKPQIWLGNGNWPGDVGMQSEADWQQFFAYYNRWMRHYAMLAEIHQMDMLCVGVEFVKATTQYPQAWRNMAYAYRSIYRGPLTYAANWGTELEQTQVWDAFDYIGMNCYYPLSTSEKPNYAELKKGFQQSMDRVVPMLAKYKKPIIFTEIGFRSIGKPWLTPHAEPIDESFGPEEQAQCYQAVCEVLTDAPWCEGIFWWKWPSYMEYAKVRKQEYSPSHRPAEKVVRDWFKKQD